MWSRWFREDMIEVRYVFHQSISPIDIRAEAIWAWFLDPCIWPKTRSYCKTHSNYDWFPLTIPFPQWTPRPLELWLTPCEYSPSPSQQRSHDRPTESLGTAGGLQQWNRHVGAGMRWGRDEVCESAVRFRHVFESADRAVWADQV
jgi:hypothetical protein